MALYLEGKTPLTRMIFPPRRQLHESRHQVYRHGRAQGSDCDSRLEWQWQVGHGIDCGDESQQYFAVYPRPSGRTEPDLGRRNLGGLVARSAQAPGAPSLGLQSAAERLMKGR